MSFKKIASVHISLWFLTDMRKCSNVCAFTFKRAGTPGQEPLTDTGRNDVLKLLSFAVDLLSFPF